MHHFFLGLLGFFLEDILFLHSDPFIKKKGFTATPPACACCCSRSCTLRLRLTYEHEQTSQPVKSSQVLSVMRGQPQAQTVTAVYWTDIKPSLTVLHEENKPFMQT